MKLHYCKMEIEKLIPSFIPTPSFDRLIRRDDTTVEQVLNESLTFRLFSQDDGRIVRFFVKHADARVFPGVLVADRAASVPIDFFAVLFKTDALRVPVMDEIVGVLLETFSEENRALRFTMYKLLKLLVKIAKSDVKLAAELRKYDALGAVYMEMTNYRGSLKHPYGGGVTVLPGTAKAVATVAKPPV